MKKSLRYLAGVLVLAFALMTTGCFGDPGANLVGTWTGTVNVGGADQPLTLTLNSNYLHKNFLVIHGYSYQATATAGAAGSEVGQWAADVLSNEEMDQLLDLLLAYVQSGSEPTELPNVDVVGWGAVTDLTGSVNSNKFILYIPDVMTPGSTPLPVFLYGDVDGNTMYLEGNVAGTDVENLILTKTILP